MIISLVVVFKVACMILCFRHLISRKSGVPGSGLRTLPLQAFRERMLCPRQLRKVLESSIYTFRKTMPGFIIDTGQAAAQNPATLRLDCQDQIPRMRTSEGSVLFYMLQICTTFQLLSTLRPAEVVPMCFSL